ncbi:hypothetical protein AB0S30_23665, partial [Escherichia coli]
MAWNTDVSADGKPHSLWKQGRALASQPESVTKTNIAENRIHRSGVNARKRAARTVLTGMCYSVGSATRQGSSSPTRFIGQSAMT